MKLELEGLGWFLLAVVFGVILIPWPHLLPVSLFAWAVIWLLTPSWERDQSGS